VELQRPKLRHAHAALCDQLFGRSVTRTNALETLVISCWVRGLSDRDVEAMLVEVFGEQPTVSRTTASRIRQRLLAEFDAWSRRDLSKAKIDCRDQWITAGIFATLELLVLQAYDQMIGLELGDLRWMAASPRPPAAGMLPGAARSTAANKVEAFHGDRGPWHTTGYGGGRRQPQRLAAAGSHPGHLGTPWVTTPAAYGPSGPRR
jgi:hypothetical protein